MPPAPAKDYTRFGFLILAVVLLVALSSKFFSGPFEAAKSKTFSFIFGSTELSKIVQANLEGKKGSFSIYIESLADGEKYGYNASEVFPSASLYKLYLMAAVMEAIDNGQLTFENEITATKTHLIDVYGGVDFGYEQAPETITYTVEEALTRVGRTSDNFASLMLAEKIGWDKVQAQADSLEATSTTIKSPISTTASDTALFFKKLYLKEIVSPQASEKIMEFLSLNKVNDRIPAKIMSPEDPQTVKIIHKTGELSRLRHDAGIVYLESQNIGRPYIIVLLSKDLEDENQGVETLANISKDVFEYFRSKND